MGSTPPPHSPTPSAARAKAPSWCCSATAAPISAATAPPGRARAEADALAASRQVRSAGLTCVLVDTSPRPAAEAKRLAAEMGALYLPLPYADSAALSCAIRASTNA